MKKVTLFLLILMVFVPLYSQYEGRYILKTEEDEKNICSPTFVIFERYRFRPIYISHITNYNERNASYYVNGEFFYCVKEIEGIKRNYKTVINKYIILKDTINFIRQIDLGLYEKDVKREFRNDTLELNTKDSTIIIDLPKFEIISTKKRKIIYENKN